MNQFYNPEIGIPFLIHYFTDPTRLQRLSKKQLKSYQNKRFKKILTYALKVPLYKQKITQKGLTKNDLNTLLDLNKLPLTTKTDITSNYPDNIIPPGYPKHKAYVVCTGGTSGNPVSIYTDFATILRALGPTLVQMRYFKFNPRTTKVAHIGNFNRYRIDKVFQENFLPKIKTFYSSKNHLNIDVNTPIKDMITLLNTFQPDLIISYPTIFQHLAYLKRQGEGTQINPKLLHVGGAMLDEYTRHYVEDAFNCDMLNIYLSVEAQASIAFECPEHNWHLHSDFFHLEAIDSNNQRVAPGERGRIVLTRLFGWGTPIINYTGMNDWITLNDTDDTCSCGYKAPILKKPVEGRMRANIILRNGKIFPPGAFCFISPVMQDLNTYMIKQYQIIQQSMDEIEILLVIDDTLRRKGPSFETVADAIKKQYHAKVGTDVTITVREVDEIKATPGSGKPAPIVISHVNPKDAMKVLDTQE